MRKISTILSYIIVFWGIIPALILIGSSRLEILWESGFSPHPVAGIIVLLLSTPLLFITIVQYFKYSGELPVSAYPPKTILRRGVYNYWRHPIYLFYISSFFGIALILGSKAMLLIVLPAFTLLTWLYIHYEEKLLTKRFGKAYLYYKNRTGLVFPILYQLLRYPGLLLMKLLYHFQIRHKERIPLSPPYFVISEHKNYSDPILIGFAIQHPISYLTTYEMFRSSFMIKLMKLLSNIPRKRFKPDFGLNKRMLEALDKGAVIGIFPEGERSWTGETQHFKPEVLKLLLKKNDIPIVPVKIQGNYAAWPRWAKGFRRYKVVLEIKEPFFANSDFTMEELENSILKRLGDSEKAEKIPPRIKGIGEGLEKVFYRCSECFEFNSFVPKENNLTCQKCGFSIHIADDLSISFQKKEILKQMSIAEYYKSIRVTADDNLFYESDANLEKNEFLVDLHESGICNLSMEHGIVFEPVLTGHLRLTEDRIVCQNNQGTCSFLFSDINSATTESNNKLQLYHSKGQLYQLQFEKSSVLQWQDIITSAIYLKTSRLVNNR